MSRSAARRPLPWLARVPRQLAGLVALLMAVAGLALVAAAPAQAATHEVSGQVFRDFNSNGARDTNAAASGIASDVGLGGVTVTATDAKGALVATTTTAANGTYTLNVVDPWSSDVRIEFSGLPAGYESSFHGADSGTSVQFVQVGSAPLTGVDFAANAPEDFSQGVAPLVNALHGAGLRSHASNATKPSLVSIPFSAPRNDTPAAGDYSQRTTLGLLKDTGTLWGGTFQKSTGDLFATALLRRHADLGPLGLGGIYVVEDALKADGTINGAAELAKPWLDVTTLGINVGTIPDAATRGLGAPNATSRDAEAYTKVGKVGIGGTAVSADGRLLYFVNLFDKRLYAINIADKTLAASFDLGLAADERPWALTLHRGKVYLGYAETGEGINPAPAAADLDIVVRAAPESALDTLGDSSTEVLRNNLGYGRGAAYGPASGVAARFKTWHPWTDTWDASNFTFVNWPGTSWAQASLTDLQFTTQGDLVLGLQDRFGLQSGNRNLDPFGPSNTLYEAVSLGDVLIAGPDGSGGYTLESNGTVSGRTTTAGASNEGPGGREFFQDANIYGGTVHHEAALGGLSTLAGIDQVVGTAYDPTSQLRTSGVTWFSTVNGSVAKGYQHSPDGGTPPNTNGNFQKAGGLGDVQVLANLAPLEIGNRVWFDADQDGVQDADEPAIDGVTVELFAADGDGNPTGPALDTTTTSNGGEYYFDADPDTRYVVVFTPPSSGNWVTDDPRFGTVRWEDMAFTDQYLGGATVDSNVNPDGEAVVETGSAGQNDHTIDAGLVANVEFRVEKLIDTDGGTPAAGQQFTIDLDAQDFRGDPVTLTQSSVTLGADATSVPIQVPVGTSVKVTEPDAADYDEVTVSAPAGAAEADDYYLVEASTPVFAFRVTNKLFKPGAFTITKAVTGDFDLTSDELQDAAFTVSYSYAGGSGSVVLDQDNDWEETVTGLPYGAVVTLTETVIDGQAASVDFATPTWSVDGATAVPGASAQVTIGNGTTAAIVLTNPATELLGGFELTKSVVGDGATRVPNDFEFVAEYSTNGGSSWTDLDPVTKADPQTDGPANLPVGTEVLIREKAPADLDGVEWVSEVFSGTGVTPAAGADPARFVISDSGPIAVTLTNTTEEINGQFSITKQVTGPGVELLEDGHEFTVNWTLDGDAQAPIVLENGEFFTSTPIAEGSEVTITEVTPTGGLPAGATWGTPVLQVGSQTEANGATFTIGDAVTPLAIVLENPTDVTPEVEITKGDGDAAAGTIAHEADTVRDGEYYDNGETRDIVIRVTNPGPEPLREVELTDVTRSGAEVAAMRWTFPDGTEVAADWDAASSTWSARWDATFAPGVVEWEVGDVIVGTATLTANASDAVHQDRVRVDAVGAYSGKPVDDTDDYNAFTAAIQVIKYDGDKADPEVQDGNGDWVIPGKPLADPMQDANDADHAVEYVAGATNKVRWVVTNTGPTSLTRISLADVTGSGPDIGSDWTADLSPFGGPADYSFVKDGDWDGILPSGASFFAEGTLVLPADTVHDDTVTVTGVPIVPDTNPDGTPSDEPLVEGGEPVIVRDDAGDPVVLTDDDPFHAYTPAPTGTSPGDDDDEDADDSDDQNPGSNDEENGGLPDAGNSMSRWVPFSGLLLVLAGAALLIAKRRRGVMGDTA